MSVKMRGSGVRSATAQVTVEIEGPQEDFQQPAYGCVVKASHRWETIGVGAASVGAPSIPGRKLVLIDRKTAAGQRADKVHAAISRERVYRSAGLGVTATPPYFLASDFDGFQDPKDTLLWDVEEFITNANARSFPGLAGKLNELPSAATALRTSLSAALETRAQRLFPDAAAYREFLCDIRMNSHTSSWDLLRRASEIGTVHEIDMWLSLAEIGGGAPTQIALRGALMWHRERLQQRNAGAAPNKTFVKACTFGQLARYRAQRRACLAPMDPSLERALGELPGSLRDYVERSSHGVSLRLPAQPGVYMAPGDSEAHWEEEAWAWEQAGLPLIDDREINQRLAIERLLQGQAMPSEAPEEELSSKQMQVYKAVKRGEMYSANWPPPFVKRPSEYPSLLELAKGVLLQPSPTVEHFFAPLVNDIPEGLHPAGYTNLKTISLHAPGISPKLFSLPKSFRAILPNLVGIPTTAERLRALPWMLLEYLANMAGAVNGDDEVILRSRSVEARLSDQPELLSFFRECAPEATSTGGVVLRQGAGGNAQRNTPRQVFAGALTDEAYAAAERYAPALVNGFPPSPKLSLGALDMLVDDVRNSENPRPFEDMNFIGVQHLLADTAHLMGKLVACGLDPKRAKLAGIPYSTARGASAAVRELGIEVDDGAAYDLPYDIWRPMQICNLIEDGLRQHARNGAPILALDDGGYITKALHAYYPEHAHKFCIVEQTTRGHRIAEATELGCDVISGARAESKKLELPGVRTAIEARLEARLEPFVGSDFRPEQPALLVGYGWIGGIVGEFLARQGRDLIIVEPDAKARAQAQKLAARFGIRVTFADSVDASLGKVAMAAGATGTQSYTRAQLAKLQPGTPVFSCSSGNVEFEETGDSHFHEDMVVEAGDTHYIVLNSGYPLNFSGQPVAGDPSYLQYTMGTLFACLRQGALSLKHPARQSKQYSVVEADEIGVGKLMAHAERAGHPHFEVAESVVSGA